MKKFDKVMVQEGANTKARMASPRGYAALHWNHERALEAEAELGAWLCRAHPGKVIPTGLGPAFRERFKQKFPIDVFSTPDLVYVPEFRGENGEVSGYGPPLAFDVVERLNYAWGGWFSTILAQASKTDDLVRFDKKNSFLAYKWKDGVWTFALVDEIAALNLKPKFIDTVIGGKTVRQKNYEVPRGLWYGREEFKTLMLEEIRNFEPIDRVRLLGEIDRAREDDMQMYVGVLRDAFGEKRLREVAKYFLSMQPMIKWDPNHELEPSVYVFQRVLVAALGKTRKLERGKQTHERTRSRDSISFALNQVVRGCEEIERRYDLATRGRRVIGYSYSEEDQKAVRRVEKYLAKIKGRRVKG